ncbi:LysR family transcriptional regulator [Sodalis ligni]|jgi:LysR family glycine cleavage system transcriptional activator|uniref:DNA-binding transcriptional LysR family regulator n=1 Tax=Sodalis ligni TaxID=2697027 RepID=A0A4R1NAU2_9GAMM|nr:LysR family transcriptional regulator [Sodalis ligni]QWA12057.1 LysR family transcriptional regulator [Sodalis ligni]TCL04534.1 DNA-binding transcriptional LysR family regulator [Sodalis ligni]
MKDSDISLTAIRALVAIGRHGNFTRAAAELGITQSAVSRHVANLEAVADGPLFERRGATVVFTPRGSQFYESVKDAISTIELATQQLAYRGHSLNRIRVRTSMPSFATAVMAPLLGGYTERNDVQIDLFTSLSFPLPQDEYDVLITRDLVLPNTERWELAREGLVCVASPGLAAIVAEGSESEAWPMIAARSRPDAIAKWAAAHKRQADRLSVRATYDHYFLAVAAAAGGAGLLVVPHLLVRDRLRDGTLVLIDDVVVQSGDAYTAYVNPRSPYKQHARAFCQWLDEILNQPAGE